MAKVTIVLGGWIALNLAVAALLLTRRQNPRLRHRLFRWVIGAARPIRPRRWAHSLVFAHQRNH
jgi:hypothetical protein